MRGFRALAVATAVAVYGQVVLGGVVRITGSGLGCRDWPLCYVQAGGYRTLLEVLHRLLGTVGGILVLALAAYALWLFVRGAGMPRGLMRLTLGGLGLYGLQAVLGGITVLMKNSPFTVAIHLGNAELVLAAVAAVALWSFRLGVGAASAPATGSPDHHLATAFADHGVPGGLPGHDAAFRRLLVAAAIGTYAIVVSGAYVVGRGAGLACRDWPLCGSPRTDLADVHFLHRIFVGAASLLLIVALRAALQRWRGTPMATVAALTAVALSLEVAVGGAQVLLRLPESLRALHVALASAVWTGVALLLAAAWLEGRAHVTPEVVASGAPVRTGGGVIAPDPRAEAMA